MSIWETIINELHNAQIEAYPPATKVGECTRNYVVVKQDGSSQVGNFSSEFVYYQFMLYVPQNKYDTLDGYEAEVKKVLDTKLYPVLKPTASKMPDYYDDEKRAHMRSFIYRNSVRNKHL